MAGGIFNVDANTFLAEILLRVVTAAAVLEVRQIVRAITFRTDFDLDYLGAHLGHRAGHGRPRDVLGEIERFVTVEHMPGRVLHSILASIIAAGNRTGGIVSASANFTRLFRRYELSTPRFIVKLWVRGAMRIAIAH